MIQDYHTGAERGELAVEYRWQVADGSYHWFADSALRTAIEGEFVEMTGIMRDITREKEVEDAIKSSERYYRGLFDGAHDAILVFDPETEEILDANATACELYQVSRDELIGLCLETFSTDIPSGKARISETIHHGSLLSFETIHKRRDGSKIPLEVNASVVEFHGRQAILSLNRDMSERKVLEERLRQMGKMEAVGRLAAGLAHDFNNLLAVILGVAELSLRTPSDRNPFVRQFETIRETTMRCINLTRSMLGFSRHEILQRQSLDLNSLVEEMRPIFRGAISSAITLRIEKKEKQTTVHADKGHVEQILLNLVLNARDAMPDGGDLLIEIESIDINKEFLIGRPWARTGRYGRLRVADSGYGMNEAVLARALDPFFSTKGRNGTGLGLTSVYGLTKQHGGMIELSSHPRQGTVADVYLPEGDGSPASDGEPVLTEAMGQGERILLVEDEPVVRDVTRELLSHLGYHPTCVSDGREAIAALVEAAEPFDLVFTDLTMPRMGGIDLYHAARARGFEMGFVFASGHNEDARIEGLPQDERTAFLRKPYNLANMSKILRTLIQRKTESV